MPRPETLPRSVADGLRALDRDRRVALVVAVGLLLALAAPWYETVAVVRGIDGAHLVARQTASGAASLSLAAVVSFVVGLLVALGLPLRAATTVEGLGARARRRARGRADGTAVAAGGVLVALTCLVSLADHPAARVTAAHASVHVRVGLIVALLLGLGLVALGARIARGEGSPDQPDPPAAPGRRSKAKRVTSRPTSRIPTRMSQRTPVM